MRRVKWFGAEWPVSIRSLASRMKAHPFTEERSNGFLIDRVRDSFINGRYVEKITFEEILTTPFGQENRFERTEYRQVEFNLFSIFPNVELWDAPRSTQGFVSRLLEMNNFNMTLNPLHVDVLDWAKAIQGRIKSKLLIDEIQIAGLELEPGVSAKISLRSEKDVREALARLTKGKSFELERVHATIRREDLISTILLTSSASAKLDEGQEESILEALRVSLPN